jgi:hypothetical protein
VTCLAKYLQDLAYWGGRGSLPGVRRGPGQRGPAALQGEPFRVAVPPIRRLAFMMAC